MRALVADADPLARHLIRTVLRDAGIVVVAEAGTTAEAVELVLRDAPDVVLVDGVAATRAVHVHAPGQRIVVLAREEDDHEALLALEAGASGYLSKELVLDALPRTLAAVVGGEAAVSRRVTRRPIEHFRERAALRPIKGPLTAREWEVVGLLDPERTTDDIAETLVISSETVRSHVKSIMRKLDVHSRHEAPAAAERLRLTTA